MIWKNISFEECTDKRNYPFIYRGKLTACHSQALFLAYGENASIEEFKLFELLTSVPFGVRVVEDDANRILTCYMDPDRGLDIALGNLEIPYRTIYFSSADDQEKASTRLKEELKKGPLVAGPLNMGGLSYLFGSEALDGCDHYVHVVSIDSDFVTLNDPEGHVHALLPLEQFLQAWSNAGVPEGRGFFTMRSLESELRLTCTPDITLKAFYQGCDNLIKAQNSERCGPDAYYWLKDFSADLVNNPRMCRGLSFAIPTRVQRNALILDLCRSLTPKIKNIDLILKTLNRQLVVLNEIHSRLLANETRIGSAFSEMGDLEGELTRLIAEGAIG